MSSLHLHAKHTNIFIPQRTVHTAWGVKSLDVSNSFSVNCLTNCTASPWKLSHLPHISLLHSLFDSLYLILPLILVSTESKKSLKFLVCSWHSFLFCVYVQYLTSESNQNQAEETAPKFNLEKQKNCNGWDLYICSFFPEGNLKSSTRQGTVSLTWGVNGQSSGRGNPWGGNPDRQETVEGFNSSLDIKAITTLVNGSAFACTEDSKTLGKRSSWKYKEMIFISDNWHNHSPKGKQNMDVGPARRHSFSIHSPSHAGPHYRPLSTTLRSSLYPFAISPSTPQAITDLLSVTMDKFCLLYNLLWIE